MAISLAPSVGAQRRTPVIGILGSGYPEDPTIALNLAMFARGLRQEGFVDGQNVRIEYRWARNQPDRLAGLAAELVALPVDVIVNEGGTPTVLAAKRATATIPIVFHASDAIADGVVDNLAQPGGNLTGSSQFSTETVVKGFQFLTELAPSAPRIGMVSVGLAPAGAQRIVQEIQASQAARKVAVNLLPAQSDSELEAAYAALARERAAVLVFAVSTYAEQLAALAARHRVPAVYNQRAFAAAGGLLSYGASIPAAYVLKGIYAGKILKGAKPRDLPVGQQVRAGPQPQDRRGARPHHPAVDPDWSRRSDRVSGPPTAARSSTAG